MHEECDRGYPRRTRATNGPTTGQSRARFTRANLFDVPLRDANVVTMYLLPKINLALRPRLLTELRPGTRIVTHAFDMGEWRADEERLVADRRVFLWIIPAVVGGDWLATLPDGREDALTIDQRFQDVTGTLGTVTLTGTLRGTAIRFAAAGRTYTGTVGEAAITGEGWRAVRMP